jgi:hypothetical protein
VVLVLCGFFSSGCRSFSLGPAWLPEINGQVLSRDTNTPVPGVEIFATYYEPAAELFPTGSNPVITLFVTTEADGRFHFPRRLAPTLGSWIWEIRGPRINIFHPHYGFNLVRTKQRPAADLRNLEPIELSIFPPVKEREEGASLCQQCSRSNRVAEEGCERYQEIACAPGGRLVHRNGQIAVEGPYRLDGIEASRKQKGDWTFYAEDGSIAVTGRYGDGNVGVWTFFAPDGGVLRSLKFCPGFGRQAADQDCPVKRGQNPPVRMLER